MTLVSSFLKLVQQLAVVMTAPTFGTFATVLTGWVFARRHTVTAAAFAELVSQDAKLTAQYRAYDTSGRTHQLFGTPRLGYHRRQ